MLLRTTTNKLSFSFCATTVASFFFLPDLVVVARCNVSSFSAPSMITTRHTSVLEVFTAVEDTILNVFLFSFSIFADDDDDSDDDELWIAASIAFSHAFNNSKISNETSSRTANSTWSSPTFSGNPSADPKISGTSANPSTIDFNLLSTMRRALFKLARSLRSDSTDSVGGLFNVDELPSDLTLHHVSNSAATVSHSRRSYPLSPTCLKPMAMISLMRFHCASTFGPEEDKTSSYTLEVRAIFSIAANRKNAYCSSAVSHSRQRCRSLIASSGASLRKPVTRPEQKCARILVAALRAFKVCSPSSENQPRFSLIFLASSSSSLALFLLLALVLNEDVIRADCAAKCEEYKVATLCMTSVSSSNRSLTLSNLSNT